MKFLCVTWILVIFVSNVDLSSSQYTYAPALKCEWIGNAPFCGKPTCSAGWTQLERNKYGDGHRCFTGKKVLCCENVNSRQGQSTFPTRSTTTSTRRPYYYNTRSTVRPYTAPSSIYPTHIPGNTPSGNTYDNSGNGGWRTIPITIEKSDDYKPFRPTPRPVPLFIQTPTPKTPAARSRQDDSLALIQSLDDLQ